MATVNLQLKCRRAAESCDPALYPHRAMAWQAGTEGIQGQHIPLQGKGSAHSVQGQPLIGALLQLQAAIGLKASQILALARKAHIPGTVIFIIDITFRYIVLLGNLMQDLLTAVSLRSIGRNDKKYNSVGGVMGVTFLRGTEMNKEMYEAMQCRGFTDDYEGL